MCLLLENSTSHILGIVNLLVWKAASREDLCDRDACGNTRVASHLVHGDAKAPYVRLCSVRAILERLGCHPSVMLLSVSTAVCCIPHRHFAHLLLLVQLSQQTQAKVGDLRFVLPIQENVACSKIAMHDLRRSAKRHNFISEYARTICFSR